MLRRVAARDLDAFKILVDRYQNRVLGLCLRLLHNPQHAEDVAQEVFFQVYQAAGKFRHDCLVSTWIYRIIINRCRNFNRDNRKFRLLGELRRGLKDERWSGLDSAPADRDDPAFARTVNETRELIRRAVALLPEKQKAVLILHKFEGRSYKEIAEILGTSLFSVESCLHRAKLNLQKRLAPEFLATRQGRKL